RMRPSYRRSTASALIPCVYLRCPPSPQPVVMVDVGVECFIGLVSHIGCLHIMLQHVFEPTDRVFEGAFRSKNCAAIHHQPAIWAAYDEQVGKTRDGNAQISAAIALPDI